jgi:SAM-dependent methyltransferase
MKSFWDTRYDTEQYVYGTEPNRFFSAGLQRLNPGRVLLPGEGEGRNAVFAASLGWKVDAIDQSNVGAEKALDLAGAAGVNINYWVGDIVQFPFKSEVYDAVALIFVHLPPPLRKPFHEKMIRVLKSGGILLLEAFHSEQLSRSTGGPKSPGLLYNSQMLLKDFESLESQHVEELSVELEEGTFHRGTASVVRFIGKK